MGHKVNPTSLRIGVTKGWRSQWFATDDFRTALHQDRLIRDTLNKKLSRQAAVADISIRRGPKEVTITIHTARPGIIIGRGGTGIAELRQTVGKLLPTGTKYNLEIMEIKKPELSAELVAQSIAAQIEKRVSYRRAMKQAIQRVLDAGAKGVKIMISGRLGGVEIARRETLKEGALPSSRLMADIDYAHEDAYTTYGVIGIKVWIYRGERKDGEEKEE